MTPKTTRKQSNATAINTLEKINQTGIDIYLKSLESISGTVSDQLGRPIKQVWVEKLRAWILNMLIK